MKIAIDVSPLDSDHAGRGIGQYTHLLTEGVKKHDKKNEYIFFTGKIQKKVDIVHYPYFDLFARSLSVDPKVKTVVTVHDLIPLRFPKHFPGGIRGAINWQFQKRQLQKAHAVITDSFASARDIGRYTRVSKKNIHVVYLSVSSVYRPVTHPEINDFKLEKKYMIPEKYILYVGDVNWNKNIVGLIKGFSLMKKKKEFSDLYLVLVGGSFDKNIPEAKEIKSVVSQEKIEKSVLFPGFIPEEDLAGLYNKAILYVQPSFYEGFGLSVLEAMSCGTVTAVARAGSIPEVAGDAAVYFDPNNIHEICQVMEKCLTSQAVREEKKHQGKIQAQKFSSHAFIQNTVHVYEKVFHST